MSELRIAAVQLDYQPVTRSARAVWRLDEPLSPLNPLAEPANPKSLLSNLKENIYCRDISEKLMLESCTSYINNLNGEIATNTYFLLQKSRRYSRISRIFYSCRFFSSFKIFF